MSANRTKAYAGPGVESAAGDHTTFTLTLEFSLERADGCESEDWSGDWDSDWPVGEMWDNIAKGLAAQHWGKLTAEFATWVVDLVNFEGPHCECRAVEWPKPGELVAKVTVGPKRDNSCTHERVNDCAETIDYFVHNKCEVTTLRLDGVKGAFYVLPRVKWTVTPSA